MPYLTAEGIVDTPGPLPDDKQVEMARTWLKEKAIRIASLNRASTSYGWKHVAERYAKSYISNGAFIHAAMLEGFKIKHIEDSQNAYLNISKRSHYGNP